MKSGKFSSTTPCSLVLGKEIYLFPKHPRWCLITLKFENFWQRVPLLSHLSSFSKLASRLTKCSPALVGQDNTFSCNKSDFWDRFGLESNWGYTEVIGRSQGTHKDERACSVQHHRTVTLANFGWNNQPFEWNNPFSLKSALHPPKTHSILPPIW